MISAQLTKLSVKSSMSSLISTPNLSKCFSTIFFSIATEGNCWSTDIVNLSKKASSMIVAAVNLPSSEPLPFVFAVAITLKPFLGVTTSPVFLTRTGFPSRIPWRHMILLVALSISSRSKIAPFSIALSTGPFAKTVSPSINLNPPIKSSSSVSGLIWTLMNSLLSLAQACSIKNVLPLPDSPLMYVG